MTNATALAFAAPTDASTTGYPFISLRGVGRSYHSGAEPVHALIDFDLSIERGEMVAIMGASGSGKSTLMNILGCLDWPTSGTYRINGVDIAKLDDSGLAALRREHFGFIFQRYHLLPGQSALDNVAMPAIYTGLADSARNARARELLARLGLDDREQHKPTELSGGQQQRVSIARALMNGANIILADEPTGALDSKSGEQTLSLLKELNALGHTVIIVTHDQSVAAHAARIIELQDGRLLRDTRAPVEQSEALPANIDAPNLTNAASEPKANSSAHRPSRLLFAIRDAVNIAWASLSTHRLRSALSVFGIAVGIAAVVAIMTLGSALERKVEQQVRSMRSGQITFYAGYSVGGTRNFSASDIEAVKKVPGVKTASFREEQDVMIESELTSDSAMLYSLAEGELAPRQLKVIRGRGFSSLEHAQGEPVALLAQSTASKLFKQDIKINPIHALVKFNGQVFRVVGVVDGDDEFFEGRFRGALIPNSTYAQRFEAKGYASSLTVYVEDNADRQIVINQVERVLSYLRSGASVSVYDRDSILKELKKTLLIVQAVLAAIAAISLVVGGVGVMNIMLVAVSERMQEIGIRMAVGARPRDVQLQFLIEAVVLCIAGGLFGAMLPTLLAMLANQFQDAIKLAPDWRAFALAIAVAASIGLAFGFMPARRASRLSPVTALARE